LRIALVNALSYPGFVSGATLQVHRVAIALKRRGHEVAVFSGARRPGERSFSLEHSATDAIPVTTINTEDFLGFGDRRNFDNPGAVAPLRSWISELSPDVVHAHSLQGLGAGWIDATAQSRPVLVTMHDWWWICARQFLVTEALSIDAPLVDIDACPCTGGVIFNAERRLWLADRLRHVQRILAPSVFMRDSLVINGFDPAQVIADTNGVSPPLRTPTATAVDKAAPHLGFVGGEHEFKGFPLLMEARRRLPDRPLPLRISCWGAGGSVESRRLPAGVEVLTAYAPDQTAQVMGSLDALAVPSLMRESFSIVAREALLHGIPVITSDSGGPEEVVVHGDNGLVVESGSPAAWAAAMRRWSGDPGLRHRLKEGAARRQSWPTPDEQASHLESVYREAVEARAMFHAQG